MLCSLLRGEGEVMREAAREVAGEEAGGPTEGEGVTEPLAMVGEGDVNPAAADTVAAVSGLGWDETDDEEDKPGETAVVRLAVVGLPWPAVALL